jgi:hypothetical protein
MAAARRIDLPPAVTQVLVGLGNFLGRHVAEGVRKTRSSALKEIGDALKHAGAVVDQAARQQEGQPEEEEEDVVEVRTPRRKAR